MTTAFPCVFLGAFARITTSRGEGHHGFSALLQKACQGVLQGLLEAAWKRIAHVPLRKERASIGPDPMSDTDQPEAIPRPCRDDELGFMQSIIDATMDTYQGAVPTVVDRGTSDAGT